MSLKMKIDEAKAFFAKCTEADGLPPVGADESSVLAAYRATFAENIDGAMDKFLDWQRKDRKGAKETGKAIGRKTECPLSKSQLDAFANGPAIDAADLLAGLVAEPRHFATGSYGYNVNGKLSRMIDSVKTGFQVSVNVTIIGSAQVA